MVEGLPQRRQETKSPHHRETGHQTIANGTEESKISHILQHTATAQQGISAAATREDHHTSSVGPAHPAVKARNAYEECGCSQHCVGHFRAGQQVFHQKHRQEWNTSDFQRGRLHIEDLGHV